MFSKAFRQLPFSFANVDIMTFGANNAIDNPSVSATEFLLNMKFVFWSMKYRSITGVATGFAAAMATGEGSWNKI
jgi:hypothetical protein